jgi:GxxExxY protein
MKSDDSRERHSSSRRRLIEEEISGKIIGAFFLVYNELGFGFLESVYVRALEVALRRLGLRVEREVTFDIYFAGERVGRHRVDMLVEGRVVVEAKASHTLPDAAKRVLLSYVTACNLELGLLLHFGPTAKHYRVLSRRRVIQPRSHQI